MSLQPTTPMPDAGPGVDLAQLFPPRLLAWLMGRQCVAARWTEPRHGAPPRELAVAEGQVVEFNFRIGSDPAVAVGLQLHFRGRGALDEAHREALSNYLVAAGRLLPGSSPATGERVVTLPWQAIVAVEHQVRNHLNSLLMNASALVLLGGERGGFDVFVEQMQRDADGCISALQRLFGTPA